MPTKKKDVSLDLQRKSSTKRATENIFIEMIPGRVPNIQQLLDFFANLHAHPEPNVTNIESYVDGDRHERNRHVPGKWLCFNIDYNYKVMESEKEYQSRLVGRKAELDAEEQKVLDTLAAISKIRGTSMDKIIEKHRLQKA